MSEKDKYLIIDIETMGQDQLENGMLCVGACIGDPEINKIIDEFEVYIKLEPDKTWEQRCLDEFWNKNLKIKEAILSKIESEGLPANEAMKKFYDWIHNRDYVKNIIIMTDTSGFDIGFLNNYLSKAKLPSVNYLLGEYRPTRDSSSFHMGVAKKLPCDGLWGAESAAAEKLGISLGDNPYIADHTPKNDAKSICWEILQIHRAIKNI